MATSSAAPKQLDPKADALYTKCLELSGEATGPRSECFNQADLVALNVAADLTELVTLCQHLIQHNLFQLMTVDNHPCYRCRSRDEASKLSAMGNKEFIVYKEIEHSHTTGIWTKTLGVRTNLHQTVLTKALKWLEGKGWVKQIKSVKFPKRKIYMLKELNPAEEVTGGPWFSDGEMDMDLIAHISKIIEDHIKEESWREGPKPKQPPSTSDHEPTKDPRFYGPVLSSKKRLLLPHSPGYTDYPTASDILDWLDETMIVQGKNITIPDMTHLLDVLVYDGKLERVGRKKVSRPATARPGAAPLNNHVLNGDEAVSVENDDEDDDDDWSAAPPPAKKRRAPTTAEKGKGKAPLSASPAASPSVRSREQSSQPQQQQPPEDEYEDMYRWVRRPDAEDVYAGNEAENDDGGGRGSGPGNGFSDVPCSRCPVFRLCEDGGPVDARSCAYFGPWLAVAGDDGVVAGV